LTFSSGFTLFVRKNVYVPTKKRKREIYAKFRIMLSFGLVAVLRQEVAQAEGLAEALLS